MKKILQALDGTSTKPVEGSDDMKRFVSIVSEGKNTKTNRLSQAETIVYMNTPNPKPVKLDETPGLFKTYLKLVEEEDLNQSNAINETKSQQPPKPRNPVAKNAGAAIGGGAAGAHKDKKKAAKQGDVKHKGKALDLAEDEQEVQEGKIKGVDGKACWKGKRYAGKEKKADGTYKDKCVPVNEGDEDESNPGEKKWKEKLALQDPKNRKGSQDWARRARKKGYSLNDKGEWGMKVGDKWQPKYDTSESVNTTKGNK